MTGLSTTTSEFTGKSSLYRIHDASNDSFAIHSRDDIDEAIRDAIVAYFNSLKNTSAAIGNEVSSESDWLKPGML